MRRHEIYPVIVDAFRGNSLGSAGAEIPSAAYYQLRSYTSEGTKIICHAPDFQTATRIKEALIVTDHLQQVRLFLP